VHRSKIPVRAEPRLAAVRRAGCVYRHRPDSRHTFRLVRNNIDRLTAVPARIRQAQKHNLDATQTAAIAAVESIGHPPHKLARSPLRRPTHERAAARRRPDAAVLARRVDARRKGLSARLGEPIPPAGHSRHPSPCPRAREPGFGGRDKYGRCCQPKERSASDIKVILPCPLTIGEIASGREELSHFVRCTDAKQPQPGHQHRAYALDKH